ncbi:MAG TPA: MBOAT family O-acyltransferase [Thermotogota bacterium]|nr:MBOAT family O-acyltransferase [Thermotogota bacterium]
MFFHSLSFALFLGVVLSVFYLTPRKGRWLVLCMASVVFYSFLGVPHLLLALGSLSVFSFLGARWIENRPEKTRKRVFTLSVVLDLSVLLLVRYLPFLTRNLSALLHLFFPSLPVGSTPVLVSIGVSFYVFQVISYLADVYLEILPAEKHFGYFFAYVSFFPKLLQGPIERGKALLPQLHAPHSMSPERIRQGFILVLWGLFKKLVVADRLAQFVDPVFSNVEGFSGLPLLVASYYYALQIYADFSGYTDIARGVAKWFGIDLTPNFHHPYLAVSIPDFWRRWHMTFSRWIMDYLFKPLQMRFRTWKTWGIVLALVITFLISGLWHGPAWTFIFWGFMHGVYMSVAVLFRSFKKPSKGKAKRKDRPQLLSIFFTFHLVVASWIFFRAQSVGDGFYVLGHMFAPSSLRGISLFSFGMRITDFFSLVAGLLLWGVGSFWVPKMLEQGKKRYWVFQYTLVVAIFLLGVIGRGNEFLYFRF